MASATACQASPVARLVGEFFHPRGCEPKALASLCSALPQPEMEELLELLALRVRQLARETTRLQEERLSWAAQAVPAPARQAGAFSVARRRAQPPFEADPAAASHALYSSSMPLLQELPRVPRPASAQPRSAEFNIQLRRNGRKVGPRPQPSPPLGLQVSAASSAAPAQPPGSLRAAASHAGLRSVHALHTQLLYTRSPALTRATAATASTAASVPASERQQPRLANGELLSAQEVQGHKAAEVDEPDVAAAATAGEAEPPGELGTAQTEARVRLRS